MFVSYLQRVGLGYLATEGAALPPSAVVEMLSRQHGPFSPDEVRALYEYPVPRLGPDGACSTGLEAAELPYHLAVSAGLPADPVILGRHPNTLRLWRLKQIVECFQVVTGVDWLGIYRRVAQQGGIDVLVKEAYHGAFSRAEFPLTAEFARGSNNSTVGLSGRAVLVQNVTAYEGPYYNCDSKVQSELCLPILGSGDRVLGIIDAESFHVGKYGRTELLQLARAACDLGLANMGLGPSVAADAHKRSNAAFSPGDHGLS